MDFSVPYTSRCDHAILKRPINWPRPPSLRPSSPSTRSKWILSLIQRKREIVATGKGFTLKISFHEDHCQAEMALSLLLRPLKSKILSPIKRHLAEDYLMTEMKKYKVTCLPSEKIIEVDGETPLLEALTDQGLYVKSSCGGHASCSDCAVKIVEGHTHINKPPFAEERLLGNVFFITKERLSCQVKISGDVTVDISAHDRERDLNKSSKHFIKRR